ncbi:flap endonuclease [Bacillus phage vB_BcgM]|nr:flap endonuclease [Bacillus phage vB_BcgM]
MQSKLFIPEKLNVGYQNRQGTYTGKLAYVIYFDESGKLRKEKSWESWRDSKINNDIFENVPTEGFVFNKSGGGNPSWSERKAFCRVYDPRGFEFEIGMDNLMYILECCDIMKGKGVIGELVYAWEGTELVLVPVESEAYKESKRYTDVLLNKEQIKGKDLKVGYTYLDKDENKYVYLGKFHEYDYSRDWNAPGRPYTTTKKKAKKFFFAREYSWASNKEFPYTLDTISSLGKKFIKELEIGCVQDFTPFQDMLEESYKYSPVDETKTEFIPINQAAILNRLTDESRSSWDRSVRFYTIEEGRTRELYLRLEDKYNKPYSYYSNNDRKIIGVEAVVSYSRDRHYKDYIDYRGSVEELFDTYTGVNAPCFIKRYLENGKYYSTEGFVPEEQESRTDYEEKETKIEEEQE